MPLEHLLMICEYRRGGGGGAGGAWGQRAGRNSASFVSELTRGYVVQRTHPSHALPFRQTSSSEPSLVTLKHRAQEEGGGSVTCKRVPPRTQTPSTLAELAAVNRETRDTGDRKLPRVPVPIICEEQAAPNALIRAFHSLPTCQLRYTYPNGRGHLVFRLG